ncbi:MAG: sulfite exporter TauE/SafE family protein [Thermoflexibacteraceae bacterium]
MPAELVIYVLAIVIGIFFGLLGGSGSLLTLPILVYVANLSPTIATTYSLFTVGVTSLVGLWSYYRRGLVHLPSAIPFALPSFIGVFTVRKFLYPILPDYLVSIGNFSLYKPTAIMLLFNILMFLAAISMVISTKNDEWLQKNKLYRYRVWFGGLMVGVLTSLVGAGGSFLIIPALVFLVRVPMKLAIGTSLLIVCLNSFIGFSSDWWNGTPIDWYFLGLFSSMSAIGIFVGVYLNNTFSGVRLRKVFGYVLVCMSFAILMKEVLF